MYSGFCPHSLSFLWLVGVEDMRTGLRGTQDRNPQELMDDFPVPSPRGPAQHFSVYRIIFHPNEPRR